MMSGTIGDKRARVPLDEFDAVCDEFLKAFEQVDVDQSGAIDASGFEKLKGLMTGGNVLRWPGKLNGRTPGRETCAEINAPKQSVQSPKAEGPVHAFATKSAGIEKQAALEQKLLSSVLFSRGRRGAEQYQLKLTGHRVRTGGTLALAWGAAAHVLFSRARHQLLALSFDDLEMSVPGQLGADELLGALGLSGAKAYLAEQCGPTADVFSALWPAMHEGEVGSIETVSEDQTYHDLLRGLLGTVLHTRPSQTGDDNDTAPQGR